MIGTLIATGKYDDVIFTQRESGEGYWVAPEDEPDIDWAALSRDATVIAICEVIAVRPDIKIEDLRAEHWARSPIAREVPRRLHKQVRGMVKPGTLHFGVWK